jgi:hypothetical protein
MSEERTTAIIERYLGDLNECSEAEPSVRALLERAVGRCRYCLPPCCIGVIRALQGLRSTYRRTSS